jgi:hypothetical protein
MINCRIHSFLDSDQADQASECTHSFHFASHNTSIVTARNESQRVVNGRYSTRVGVDTDHLVVPCLADLGGERSM